MAGLVYFRNATQISLDSLIPADYFPKWMVDQAQQQQDVVELLLGVLRLATSEDPLLRNTARDFLGQDLHSDLFHIVLAEISVQTEAVSKALQQDTAASSAAALLYFQQSLAILAQGSERLKQPTFLSVSACNHIERHLLLASSCARNLGCSVEAAKLRNQICQASQAVLEKRKTRATALTASFRNTLAAYLLSFIDDAMASSLPLHNRVEVQTSALKTLAVCFDGLCLSRVGDGRAMPPDSRMISSYFAFLLDVLQRQGLEQVLSTITYGTVKSCTQES